MGWNACDYIFLGFGILGSMSCAGAALMGPYRRGQAQMNLQWPERKYYIRLTTDKGMNPSVTWSSMKLETCKKFESAQLKYGTPTGTLISEAMQSTITLPICDVRPDCRQNMADRCTQYDRMVWNGFVLLIMCFLCLCMYGLALVLMFLSNKVKAKRNSWVMAVIGCIIQAAALAYWLYDSHQFVMRMQTLTVWPYPEMAGWGIMTHIGGLAFMIIGLVFGLVSWLLVGDGSSSSSSYEEYGEYGGGAYPAGGQSF